MKTVDTEVCGSSRIIGTQFAADIFLCNFILWCSTTKKVHLHCNGVQAETLETNISKPEEINPKLSAWLHTSRGSVQNAWALKSTSILFLII